MEYIFWLLLAIPTPPMTAPPPKVVYYESLPAPYCAVPPQVK